MKRILIGCECSGRVRDAFVRAGWDAISCDLKPCEQGGVRHIQGNVLNVLDRGWDAAIFFPDCTYLCGSGLHWNNRGRGWEKTEAALEFVEAIWAAPIPLVALENPVGIISTRSSLGKAAQSIQPYEFGDDASKRTCLWLRGFKPLVKNPADRVPGRWVEWPRGSGKMVERWGNQTDSGQNRLGPGETRAADRARTYPGIAAAMPAQWGHYGD